MSSPKVVEAASPAHYLARPGNGYLVNGFHVACLAFQRARQLKNGGRPRLETGSHKYLWVAMNEVRAGMVAWDVEGKLGQGPA